MSPSSPLGETLRRARSARNITLEDAERVTRIPRKYLEALELENFGILPAPVYARGFLRSYAGYLGIDPNDLLPFFPVGHVEEPRLDPLPEMNEPRTWNLNGIVAVGVIGLLILLVFGLYSVGQEDGSAFDNIGDQQGDTGVLTGDDNTTGGDVPNGPAAALPDLVGLTAEEAITHIEGTGASYVIVGSPAGDVPVGQVIAQDPPPETQVGPGDFVQLTVASAVQ